MSNILLVEDSRMMSEIISDSLTLKWHIVKQAWSLWRAEELITSWNLFDVLITDTSLSWWKEWLQVASCFKSVFPDKPIIAISLEFHDEWIEWNNCDRFLPKVSSSFVQDLTNTIR